MKIKHIAIISYRDFLSIIVTFNEQFWEININICNIYRVRIRDSIQMLVQIEVHII
jgi:hypothetical protein